MGIRFIGHGLIVEEYFGAVAKIIMAVSVFTSRRSSRLLAITAAYNVLVRIQLD